MKLRACHLRPGDFLLVEYDYLDNPRSTYDMVGLHKVSSVKTATEHGREWVLVESLRSDCNYGEPLIFDPHDLVWCNYVSRDELTMRVLTQ